MTALGGRKDGSDRQEHNYLDRLTQNGVWLIADPNWLNKIEISWEEFHDNLCLRYGLFAIGPAGGMW